MQNKSVLLQSSKMTNMLTASRNAGVNNHAGVRIAIQESKRNLVTKAAACSRAGSLKLRGGTQCRTRADLEAMRPCTSKPVWQCCTVGDARVVRHTPVRRASRARQRAALRSLTCYSSERLEAAGEAVSLCRGLISSQDTSSVHA